MVTGQVQGQTRKSICRSGVVVVRHVCGDKAGLRSSKRSVCELKYRSKGTEHELGAVTPPV